MSRVVGFVMDKFAFTVKKSAGPTLMAILRNFSIIVISLSTLIHTAQASGFVAMTTGYRPNSNIYAPVSPTPDAACKLFSSRTYAVLNNPTTWACYADLGYWLAWLDPVSVCPANSAGTTTCTCTKDFQPDSTATSCVPVAVQCPANSSGTAPACVCNAGFEFDAAKTSCVPKCTVLDEFPDINDSDACTKSLEKGAGKDVDKACPALDPEMVKQEQCLAKKIRDLGISYTEPSATVRTVAYQQHFVDLWKWKEKIKKDQGKWSDAQKQACAPIVAKVNAEMKKHKLKGTPSNSGPDAPHVLRKAVDIDEVVVDAMKLAVTKTSFYFQACPLCDVYIPVYISDVQDYVNNPKVNPPACKLRWGGRFKDKKIDPVHFDLFLK